MIAEPGTLIWTVQHAMHNGMQDGGSSLEAARTCRELANLIEQLELPGAGHPASLPSNFLRWCFDVELEAEAIAVPLRALNICTG